MTSLAELLAELRHSGDFITHVTSWRVLPARAARWAPYPAALHPRLAALLAGRGIAQLYSHQAQAVELALGGQHVVVTTPTASGKTLCYNLPMLQALLADPAARALCLFPTKALAHDQLHGLEELLRALGLPSSAAAAYDGDTPTSRRPGIRREARILLTNPDMLHLGILPAHTAWHDFFRGLRYVVIDEIHTYRGVFGSHVANVLRRLRRICAFYGAHPQFICTSATIANPAELAERLAGEPVQWVSENGAPRGERHMVFYDPPIVDARLGVRRPVLLEARALGTRLLQAGIQTAIFCRSRRAVEQMVLYLRQDAGRTGVGPAQVRGYRGGYLRDERRTIEAGLRNGAVRAVAATNALELGVDIGGLGACIMAGYPGTIAATWQQAGRAGRGEDVSAAFVMASASPLDQYIVTHADYFFGQSPEHAQVNPDNLYLLLSHVRCAARELPFETGERFGGEDLAEVLAYLQESGQVRQSGGHWYWAGADSPAAAVSLRAAEGTPVQIIEAGEPGEPGRHGQLVGELDRAAAPLWVHPGAIYVHQGQQYQVENLDWEAGLATVRPVAVDYYTEAAASTRIDIEQVAAESRRPNLLVARGQVRLRRRATSFRRLRLGTMEHLAWGEINLPEQELFTAACWLMVPPEVVERLREDGWWVGEHVASRGPDWPQQRDRARQRDGYRCTRCGASERPGRQHDVHHLVPFRDFGWRPGENENYRQANRLENLVTLCPSCHRLAEQQVAVQSTLSGLGRVLAQLAPLHLMCAPQDLGITSDVQAPQTGMPTIFIYDDMPGGVGLSDGVYERSDELLAQAAELIGDCPCPSGCPSCIGPAGDGERGKEQVLRLIATLREGAPKPA